MIHWDVWGRRALVTMAGQAIDRAVIRVHDDVPDRGPGGGDRVGVAVGVMAGTALAVVGSEDVRPVHDRVAVITGLGVYLAKVGRAFEYGVVNIATG